MIKLVTLPLFVTSYNSEAGATLSQEYLEPILQEWFKFFNKHLKVINISKAS